MTVLDDAVRRLVEGSRQPPFLYAIGPDDARAALGSMQAAPLPHPAIEHRTTTVAGIPVHLLRPAGAPPGPVILYAHGGGWVIGGYATHHRLATALVRAAGATVVVPDYSRTPEARYPVALRELVAVLDWIRAGGLPVPGDPGRIGLVGDCAGATMVAAVAISRPGVARTQVLLYPLGRPGPGDASAAEYATGAALRLADVRRLYQDYAPRPGDPLADPLAATEVGGLPDTLLITAEADVTRDTAERFGNRLRAAGVPVTAVRYLGTVHDFAVLDALRWTPAAGVVVAQVGDHLRQALR